MSPEGSLGSACCVLVPPGGHTLHQLPEALSLPATATPETSVRCLPVTRSVPGQCRIFYSDELRRHIPTP